MLCKRGEFIFMKRDIEKRIWFHQRKIKHLIVEASESKQTQTTHYCSRKRDSHCDKCESKQSGQKPQTKHMFVWHLPGLGPLCFKKRSLAGTLHISTQLTLQPKARLVGFALIEVPSPTPPTNHWRSVHQHPNAEAQPRGPLPSWPTKRRTKIT